MIVTTSAGPHIWAKCQRMDAIVFIKNLTGFKLAIQGTIIFEEIGTATAIYKTQKTIASDQAQDADYDSSFRSWPSFQCLFDKYKSETKFNDHKVSTYQVNGALWCRNL